MSWEMLGPASVKADPNRIAGGIPTITADDVRLALAGLRERPFLFGMAAFLGHRGSMEQIEQMLTWDISTMAAERRWGTGKDREGRHTGELTREDVTKLESLAQIVLFEVISARSRHDTYAHEEALPEGCAAVLCPACRGRGEVHRAASDEERKHAVLSEEDAWKLLRETSGSPEPAKVRRAVASQWLTKRRSRYRTSTGVIDSECQLCHGRGRFLLSNPRRASMLGVSLRTWERHWNARYAEAMVIPREWEAIAIGHVRKRLRTAA